MHFWPAHELRLRHFATGEFDYPARMDGDFLQLLDRLRSRCGFPLRVTSDFRTDVEMEAIYGSDKGQWPNSPHKRGRAADVQPIQNTSPRRLRIAVEAGLLWKEGDWDRLGLEIGTAHVHVDNDTVLRRPHVWPGVSR